MKEQINNLGKVSITVEKDYWSIDKAYDRLTVVEKEGDFGTYLSRKPVPAGTQLTNREYWIPFSSLKEEIVIAFNEVKSLVEDIPDIDEAINSINKVLYGRDISTSEERAVVVGVRKSPPARVSGDKTSSGYFINYTVDLTGAYAAGFRKVRFYGFSYSSDIVQGIICTAETDNSWTVESATPEVSYQGGYCELPITANSIKLVGTVLSENGVTNIASRYPEGLDVSYIPSTVILLTGETSTGLIETVENLDERVTELEGGSVTPSTRSAFPETFLPKKVYGVVGDTLQIFRRSMVISNNPYSFYLDTKCDQGKIFERYLEITPANSGSLPPTGLKIKYSLIDDNFKRSEEKTSDFLVASRPLSNSTPINVLCIGASTTSNGYWPSELKRRLTATRDSGTPGADGISNITFVGRKALTTSAQRPVSVNVEATGGWEWDDFYTPRDAIRFTVSGVQSVSEGVDYYYFNSSNQEVHVLVAEVNITSGSGNIRVVYNPNYSTRGLPAATSGTLTKSSGSGDATISYSAAVAESYCPFFDEDENKIDFTGYADRYCDGNIDVLIAYMGNVNEGIRGDSTDSFIASVVNEMKTLLDALHADFPSCKVIVGTAGLPNAHYGYENNYNAASNIKTWSLTYGLFRYAKAVESLLTSDDYKDWCYYANTTTEVDSENCYPMSTKAVNSRMTSTTEVVGTNGAHPELAGYQMVADSMYRCFVYNILNADVTQFEPSGPM